MRAYTSNRTFIIGACAVIWVFMGILLFFLSKEIVQTEDFSYALLLAWIAFIVYGYTFALVSRYVVRNKKNAYLVVYLLALIITAPAISLLTDSGIGFILSFATAAILPWVEPIKKAVFWLVLQNLSLSIEVFYFGQTTSIESLGIAAIHVVFSILVFSLSLVAMKEAKSKAKLRKLNAQLRATQALLDESSRLSERIRISRELHDLVGHHLTALSLNLEVTSHLVKGKAYGHVQQCQRLAKLLLNDVREVVGQLRQESQIDLSVAIQGLTQDIPNLRIHLDMPDNFGVENPHYAQTLIRCIQEVITNTIKHAKAKNLWISFHRKDNGIVFNAKDDGHGNDLIVLGNGLTGMKERLKSLGGKFTFETSFNNGFSIMGWLPNEVTT